MTVSDGGVSDQPGSLTAEERRLREAHAGAGWRARRVDGLVGGTFINREEAARFVRREAMAAKGTRGLWVHPPTHNRGLNR